MALKHLSFGYSTSKFHIYAVGIMFLLAARTDLDHSVSICINYYMNMKHT